MLVRSVVAVCSLSSAQSLCKELTSVLSETSAFEKPSPNALFGHPGWHSVATGTSDANSLTSEFTQPEDTQPRTFGEQTLAASGDYQTSSSVNRFGLLKPRA